MANDIFETKFLEAWPYNKWGRHRLLLAVSGGADSTALLCTFARLGNTKNFLVLHVNHQLRGIESEEDSRFTAHLAEKYRVSFKEERIDPGELRAVAAREGSLEAGARIIRYRLLRENAEAVGARFVLTAHHADDQIETVLNRFFRGSGVDGLAGMNPFRPLSEAVVLARPFLSFFRDDLISYLTRLGQTWRTDSSNMSAVFLRNRIRHELVPLLGELFPGKAKSAVLKLASHAAELRDFLNSQLDGCLPKDSSEVSFREDGGAIISIEALAKVPPILLPIWFRRLWRRCGWPMGKMDVTRWNLLAQMVLLRRPERCTLVGGMSVELSGNRLVIFPTSMVENRAN